MRKLQVHKYLNIQKKNELGAKVKVKQDKINES